MNLVTTAKAQALSIALEQATGERPEVQDMGDHIRVYWNTVDHKSIQSKIEKMISKKEPGEIRVEWLPVVTPIAIKKLLPLALGLVAVGFVVGKL